MTTWLRLFALALAVISGVLALVAHQRAPVNPSTRWSARAGLLMALGLAAMIVPALLFPKNDWLTVGGSLLGVVVTFTALAMQLKMQRAARPRS